MPDFLPAAELAAKSVRDLFGAVGALVHAVIPPVKVYAAADALADKEAEEEVAEPPADTLPLSVCPCESLEDSCFWCEDYPVGEFADEPVEPQAPSVQVPSFVWPAGASGVHLSLHGGGLSPQRTYVPRPPETPAASATDAVEGDPEEARPPTASSGVPTFTDLQDALATIHEEHPSTGYQGRLGVTCWCDERFDTWEAHSQHVAEIQASAVQDLIQVARNSDAPRYIKPLQK